MISGVSGVGVNNTKISFQKTFETCVSSGEVRKIAEDYLVKNKPHANQVKITVLDYLKKIFGYNQPKEVKDINVEKSINLGYGHVSF